MPSKNDEKQNKISTLATAGLLSAWLSGCATMANKVEDHNFCIDYDKFHQTLDNLDKKPYLAPVQMLYAGGGAACYMGQEIFIRLPIMIGGITECGIRGLFSENISPETSPAPENATTPKPAAAVESNLPEFCQRIK